MPAYITATGAFLPGAPVPNARINDYLGHIEGEEQVRRQVLMMNGITSRHYALDIHQQETHDVYSMAAEAARQCLEEQKPTEPVSLLVGGTTYAPLAGPGLSSILHGNLGRCQLTPHPVEVSSHAGICSASATALVGAIRAIESGAHSTAICVGAEQSTQALKSSAFRAVRDTTSEGASLRNSPWFSAVFLRYMLSDGAGACLLESAPAEDRLSFRVDWTHARSFAHETPLCMKYDTRTGILSQDIGILTKHLFRCAEPFVAEALERHGETLDRYHCVLPHMSSFFFRGRMEKLMQRFSATPDEPVAYWTNLATAGNTGAASIFVMLDEYVRTHTLSDGDRILLFVPESGQFNFVLVSLTAVAR